MITDYAKNIYRIEERMRESEARAAETSKQVSQAISLKIVCIRLDRQSVRWWTFINHIMLYFCWQLARQSVRERQMANEKRSLMQELQRSTMENSFRSISSTTLLHLEFLYSTFAIHRGYIYMYLVNSFSVFN